jgi:hypothetical protein
MPPVAEEVTSPAGAGAEVSGDASSFISEEEGRQLYEETYGSAASGGEDVTTSPAGRGAEDPNTGVIDPGLNPDPDPGFNPADWEPSSEPDPSLPDFTHDDPGLNPDPDPGYVPMPEDPRDEYDGSRDMETLEEAAKEFAEGTTPTYIPMPEDPTAVPEDPDPGEVYVPEDPTDTPLDYVPTPEGWGEDIPPDDIPGEEEPPDYVPTPEDPDMDPLIEVAEGLLEEDPYAVDQTQPDDVLDG